MTNEEAEKVLNILTKADGGCSHCANDLFEIFINQFNEFDEIAVKIFNDLFLAHDDEEFRVKCFINKE